MSIKLASIALVLLASAGAAAQGVTGDAAAGAGLARNNCVECHVDHAASAAASTGIPSFKAVAEDSRTTASGLRAFLSTPHDRMPAIVLSRREIDDLIAYIMSHKGKTP